jgi:hypothetical protein
MHGGAAIFFDDLRKVCMVDSPERSAEFLRVLVENLYSATVPCLDIDLFGGDAPSRFLLPTGSPRAQRHENGDEE